jgi:hypothetical protein
MRPWGHSLPARAGDQQALLSFRVENMYCTRVGDGGVLFHALLGTDAVGQ